MCDLCNGGHVRKKDAIPATIWLSKTLSEGAKELWAVIRDKQIEGNGTCLASNPELCKIMGLKESRLKVLLKQLTDKNLVEKVSFNGKIRAIKAVENQSFET